MYISVSGIQFSHRIEENPGKMFVKIATITLLAFIATAQGEQVWDTFLTKWIFPASTDAWFELPQNISAAKSQDWDEIFGASDFDDVIGMGYKGDPRLIVLYNTTTQNATGLEICIPVSDMDSQGVTFDYLSSPYYIEKEINGSSYYTSSIFFWENVEADTRVIGSLLDDGSFEYIPTTTEELSSQGVYEEKGCVATMGDHYYKLNNSSTCATWNPWAVISIDGTNVNSVTFNAVGMMSTMNGRNWTEGVTRSTLPILVPTTPEWLQDLLADFGYISIHTYFKDPRKFFCSDIGLPDGSVGTGLG